MEAQVEVPVRHSNAAVLLDTEAEVTRHFRTLVVLVGFGEARRLFDVAGLNDDRPTWPGKDTMAAELVDAVAYGVLREA